MNLYLLNTPVVSETSSSVHKVYLAFVFQTISVAVTPFP